MKRQLKVALDRIGLLDPLRGIRSAAFPAPDPRGALIARARTLGIALRFGGSEITVQKGDLEIRINPKHEIYVSDMVNFFDYYHGAVCPCVIGGAAVVDYSRPALQRLSRSGIEFEFPSLPESDESTETYMRTLNVKPGEVVLDLGAYAGASAYFLANAVGPSGVVVSFEPDELNFQYLQANIARHGLTNVRPIGKGIWKETTTLEFQAEGSMGSSVLTILGRNSNVKSVEVVSLDDAAAFSGAGRVDAIKMDIEGAELAVLRSAGDFLRRHRPRLIIEPHIVDGRMATDEICQLLRSYGYAVESLTQGVQDWPLIAGYPPNS